MLIKQKTLAPIFAWWAKLKQGLKKLRITEDLRHLGRNWVTEMQILELQLAVLPHNVFATLDGLKLSALVPFLHRIEGGL